MIPTKTRTKMRAIAQQSIAPSSPDSPIPEVYVQAKESIEVEGTASPKAMYCTLTISRAYLSPDQRALTRNQFATVTNGAWTADVGKLVEGRYLLSACRDDEGGDGDVVWLLVGSTSIKPFLHIVGTNVKATPPKVVVTGTVDTQNNPVHCSLTPIDANGTYTGGTIYNQDAQVNGFGWTVTFQNPVTHLYSFEATANGEGTVSEPINVP
jgi:hypothetical protein